MEVLSVFDVLRQSVWVALISSLPILLLAMGIGLVVGILQTATSIQEQTLVFIPKIIAVLVGTVFFGAFIFGRVGEFTIFILGNLHRFVQ
ncbi:MAG TPA: flagellar biosynthetic protein FliQ [Synergistaceae bacterium]|nr:flagellar biosynthetic protein FliQ [Synergistaceae bacterium]HPJ26173.1 flagellar biosynthetic protein FliQ [Synergistaceae bacterium]HPQ38155.1 flagellar biosynthetic protein FliQ [Synergistaceae bacterium]